MGSVLDEKVKAYKKLDQTKLRDDNTNDQFSLPDVVNDAEYSGEAILRSKSRYLQQQLAPIKPRSFEEYRPIFKKPSNAAISIRNNSKIKPKP